MTIQITNNDIDSIFIIANNEENYTIEEFKKAIANPVEFNNGCCTAFAYHYAETIKDCIICDSTEYFIVYENNEFPIDSSGRVLTKGFRPYPLLGQQLRKLI